jgi:hypothetical protein
MAPVEADIDKSVSAKRNLRIIFLHSGTGEFRSRAAHGVNRDGLMRWQVQVNRSNERTNSAGKCGQIYGGSFAKTGRSRIGSTLSTTI